MWKKFGDWNLSNFQLISSARRNGRTLIAYINFVNEYCASAVALAASAAFNSEEQRMHLLHSSPKKTLYVLHYISNGTASSLSAFNVSSDLIAGHLGGGVVRPMCSERLNVVVPTRDLENRGLKPFNLNSSKNSVGWISAKSL